MGIFGWNYPPGCSGTPADEPCGCEVCLKDCDDCICPECPACGEHGNPKCYEEHGMIRTPEQTVSAEFHLDAMRSENYDPEDYL